MTPSKMLPLLALLAISWSAATATIFPQVIPTTPAFATINHLCTQYCMLQQPYTTVSSPFPSSYLQQQTFPIVGLPQLQHQQCMLHCFVGSQIQQQQQIARYAATIQLPYLSSAMAVAMQVPFLSNPLAATMQSPNVFSPMVAAIQSPYLFNQVMQSPYLLNPMAATIQSPYLFNQVMQSPYLLNPMAMAMEVPFLSNLMAVALQLQYLSNPIAAAMQLSCAF